MLLALSHTFLSHPHRGPWGDLISHFTDRWRFREGQLCSPESHSRLKIDSNQGLPYSIYNNALGPVLLLM